MDATEKEPALHVSRTEHADGWTVAADLYPLADENVTVDLIDATAVVAVDTPIYRTEFDIELPDDTGTAFVRNGVVAVESH